MNKIITKEDIEKIIIIKNGQEVVRSDALAKVFGKQHKDVLKVIRQKIKFILSENYRLKKFFIEEEAKTKNRTYTRYYLTRKGFDFVALSLQGRKADLYKLWYIDSFHDKQRVIEEHKLTTKLNNKDDLWVEFRNEGKLYRTKLTDAIRDTILPKREEEGKFNTNGDVSDGNYYVNYTKLIYKALKIELPKGTNPRDVLDKRTLIKLETLEDKVADMIVDKANEGIYYKEVYKQIKEYLNKIELI